MQVNEDISHADAAVLRAEQRSLYTHMYTMLFLALLGFAVYAITRVSATQLDGVISLINAAAAFIAARLALTAGLRWRTFTRCSAR